MIKTRLSIHRILVLLIISALCLSLFTGCKGSSSVTTTEKTTVAATTAGSSGSTTAGRLSLLKNESNVTLPGKFPIAEKQATLSVAMGQSNFVLSYDYKDNYQTKWMQDLSNVKIDLQLYPEAGGGEKFSILVNSGAALPDVVIGLGVTDPTARYVWGQAGVVIPLQEYYQQLGYCWNNTLKEFTEYTGKELIQFLTSPDNNLYGMVHVDSQLRNHYPRRAWINTEWLKKLNMKPPTTQSELVAFLRACKNNDLNGNGKTDDQIALVGSAGGWYGNVIEYLMNQYIYVDSDMTSTYYLLKNKILDVAFDKPEWRDGLRFVKSLYKEGLISELSFTQKFSDYTALMTANPTIVGIGVSGDASSFFKNYEAMGTVKGPNGVGWHTYVPTQITARAAITKDCKNPALAFRWLEMGYQNEYTLIQRYGAKGVNWDYVDKKDIVRTMYDGIIDMNGSSISYFKQLEQVWMKEQKSHWQQCPLTCFFDTTKLVEVIDKDTFTGSTVMTDSVRINYKNAPEIADCVNMIVYTDDEVKQYNEQRTVLNNYVKECMTRFVLGDMNIETGWDAYLQELKNMGYKDLLAIDQKAYNRTMGIK